MSAALRLGYIGLGDIGAPMARRLIDWPGSVTVFDVRPEAMAPLVDDGAIAAADLAAVAAADVISVTVLDDLQVRRVLAELAGHARPGTVVAIHSTIDEATTGELAAVYARQGIAVIDAPVSGGAGAAARGELATMVGASEAVFETVQPVFARWASLIVHAGEPGAGTRMKLARNMLTFTAFATAGEAQALAEAAGLSLVDLGRVVRHTDALTGGAGAIMFRDTTAALAPDDRLYQPLSRTCGLGEKDLQLALHLGRGTGVALPLAELALQRLAANLGVPHPNRQGGTDG